MDSLLKLCYKDQVKLVKELTGDFHEVQQDLLQKFQIERGPLIIRYKDEEGDFINLQDDNDLQLFRTQSVKRVYVESPEHNGSRQSISVSYQSRDSQVLSEQFCANQMITLDRQHKSMQHKSAFFKDKKWMARISEELKRHSMQVMSTLPVHSAVLVHKQYVITNTGLHPFPKDTVLRCVEGMQDQAEPQEVGALQPQQQLHVQLLFQKAPHQKLCSAWRLAYCIDEECPENDDIKFFGPRVKIQIHEQ